MWSNTRFAIAYGGRLRHRKAQKCSQSLHLAWNSRQFLVNLSVKAQFSLIVQQCLLGINHKLWLIDTSLTRLKVDISTSIVLTVQGKANCSRAARPLRLHIIGNVKFIPDILSSI
ncbi:MAG: hypothetical protein V7L23_30650, partial [Nostoc sp.]